MGVTISGTFSGLNVSSIISTLIAADSVPITNLQNSDTSLESQSTTLGALSSAASGRSAWRCRTLGAAGLFQSQVATSSNTLRWGTRLFPAEPRPAPRTSTCHTARDDERAAQRQCRRQLRRHQAKYAPPAASENIDSVLDESSVAGQTFSINGTQITLSDSDTLQNVLDQINGSGAGVTATYDAYDR